MNKRYVLLALISIYATTSYGMSNNSTNQQPLSIITISPEHNNPHVASELSSDDDQELSCFEIFGNHVCAGAAGLFVGWIVSKALSLGN